MLYFRSLASWLMSRLTISGSPFSPKALYIGCTLWKVLGVRFSAWLVEVQHRGALNKTKGGAIGVKIFLHTSYVLAPSHGHCSYGEEHRHNITVYISAESACRQHTTDCFCFFELPIPYPVKSASSCSPPSSWSLWHVWWLVWRQKGTQFCKIMLLICVPC